ncbi:MAG TPA: hypothetical protein VGA79_04070 [Desulfobaccales bacterium]
MTKINNDYRQKDKIMMKVEKSSRHSKITGNFAEGLILYWLSKYGFECALVDHVGVDIIARNPLTQELMGISVKSRSRSTGKEGQYVHISNDHFEKIEEACRAFACVPYLAVVVDEGTEIHAFITSMAHFLFLFPRRETAAGWKMNRTWLDHYEKDPEIKYFRFRHETINWWK